MKILGKDGKEYKYGDKTAMLYTWDYEWINKINESISFLKKDESADKGYKSKLDKIFNSFNKPQTAVIASNSYTPENSAPANIQTEPAQMNEQEQVNTSVLNNGVSNNNADINTNNMQNNMAENNAVVEPVNNMQESAQPVETAAIEQSPQNQQVNQNVEPLNTQQTSQNNIVPAGQPYTQAAPETIPVENVAPQEQQMPEPEPVIQKAKDVYILVNSLNVRAIPSLESARVAAARVGQKYEYVSENENWVEIRLSPTLTGWVFKQYVSISERP